MNPQCGNRSARIAFVLSSLFASVAPLGSQAYAQPWLPDRAYTEGPGIRAGDLEIHPGVAVRGGYDTNVFRADGKERTAVINGQNVDVTQRTQGAGILAVTPHVHVSTLSDQRKSQGEDRNGPGASAPAIAFRGGVAATYFHYFIDNAPKNVEIDTDLWLGILPTRPVNVDLNVAYTRNVRPFTQNAFDKNAYNFDSIAPRARINFGSRSKVLTGYVGYAPRGTIYESSTFDYLNNFTHGIEAGAGWRFLPNTAFVYDARFDLQNYDKDNPFLTISPVLFADNKQFRTRLGINGAVTRRLQLRILAGYAAVAFDDKGDARLLDEHEDVIGEATLTYDFGPGGTSRLSVGYNRDLSSSALGGWARLDRGSLSLRTLLGGVFLLSLEGGLAKATYGRLWGYDRDDSTMPVPLGTNNNLHRDDIRVDGAIRGEYRVTNYLSIMADVSVQSVITDFDYALRFQGGANPVPDPAGYLAVLAFGGVRAHY